MTTYAQIQKKIALLQRQADSLRDKEVAGVIDRIKVAISHYGLTAQQLGFGGGSGASPKAARGSRKSSATGTRYSDGAGRDWSGRGPRPRWLREALAAGRALEDFRVSGAPAKAAPPAGKAARAQRRPSTVVYRDDAGHSWTGRGPQPRWLKEALAQGKTLSDLAG
ncbi:H-NS family nucleoid-associated regulatory protein [Variovorax sp. J31P179]|jgi:DNA-binding protein H-NS|uniref:H-NS family nucleoid-associated regulatory protein n=1 Tax=Variovorax sp. J31P179 TaxID=3053508 RepID=UPI0025772DAE|nr:H-NS family nucleoid-associated regulatory protein [Variovorax sp. J31P179]MDM0079056.1 H-NS family nucleoid-associated regulatory protein [Variovorax sp. J31P179]